MKTGTASGAVADSPMARISDVARAAGVSPATVSRVVNQPDLVARDKRDRVLAAIDALDYRPNPLARSLRAGAHPTLALLVGDVSQPFQGDFAKAIARAGEKAGYRLLLYDLDHSRQRLIDFVGAVQPQEIQGVIIATADEMNDPEIVATLAKGLDRGLAIVCTSQAIDDVPVPVVISDQPTIGHSATAHLIERGWRDVVLLGAGTDWRFSRGLGEGYLRARAEAGLPSETACLLDGAYRVDQSRRVIDPIIAGQKGPIGVVAINVRSAIGVLQAAADYGRSVPGDVAIICCENVPLAAELRPALSVVGVDRDEVAELALRAISNFETARGTVSLVSSAIIARTSTGR